MTAIDECILRRPDFTIRERGPFKRANWTHRGIPYELHANAELTLAQLVEACLRSIVALDEREGADAELRKT